ncbi:HEAT repeat-containing protein 1-like [Centruroides sculpturatus]|uniref:HEAT repeat-containing protein 1-like n=1 Tax=Centruroides sculpturatus TaxID=218467 RepID=UPI000C6E0B16|nr:HEAT repeat-containing protein 1-like [Centruroides sculpturatus]
MQLLNIPVGGKIENDIGSDEDYQDRIIIYVSPCIAQFAVALADDTLWKPVNYQIMLKSPHNSPKVRFATLHELVQKLGENYLILLPESIPFLAELMEGSFGLEHLSHPMS